MINSFWNICSTCPMPKEEKLNSEYKRNYVWHQQYKPLAQDVVSCAPQSIAKEIGMQRRKQYPELAYRSHEVIRHDVDSHSKDVVDLRARSEEREAGLSSKSGPRSRSAEPGLSHQQQKMIMVQSYPPISAGRVSMLPNTEEFPNIAEQPSDTSEYQSQFAWPKKESEVPCMARKSISMSVIKGATETDSGVPKSKLAPVHRPCVKHKEDIKAEKKVKEPKKLKTEYKSKYKPFTSYVYVDGQWKKTSRLVKVPEKENENCEGPWFVEVVERLQKANEYRWRGHGHPVYGDLLPDIYKKTPQVSAPRPKVVAPDVLVNQPKSQVPHSKKREVHVKETQVEAVINKKKDRKSSTSLRRPKSAEPAKSKEVVKQKRPATTPPAKQFTHSSAQKRATNKEEAEKKPKARTSSRKPKEPCKLPAASSSSSGSKKPPAPSPSPHSSGGKVWLQSGQSVPESKQKSEPLVREASDAVRPSSLSHLPSKSQVADHVAQEGNESKENEGTVNDVQPVSALPQSSVVPLTHVRTPEEVTGVKSPDPENWTVPIESSERLQWSGTSIPEKSSVNLEEPIASAKEPEVSEDISKFSTVEESVPLVAESKESSSSSNPNSSKLTTANVLDRARSRLDQFWGKNK